MLASAYIAASLDGFIAREDGGLDWLPAASPGSDEDYGYAAFMETVDFLVMGRHTYEQVLTFNTWPYGDKPVVVLSSRPVPVSEFPGAMVEQMVGTPADITAALSLRGARHLYIDGGRTIQLFLAAGMLQELIITRIPVLLGRGIPLFGSVPHDIRLQHVEMRAFADGLVQNRYRVMQQ